MSGAGTSGRLGVLDAAECPPTFGTPPEMVVGIIAGGARALLKAVEGAEDDVNAGIAAMDDHQVRAQDVVIGIAASGTTPYVRAALGRAQALGARTGLVACAEPPALLRNTCDVCIVVLVGPEVITGSTRMKAGTATKLVLNTITTGAMIRLGKTYGNLMVDLRASNAKLEDRSHRIVMETTGTRAGRRGRGAGARRWPGKDGHRDGPARCGARGGRGPAGDACRPAPADHWRSAAGGAMTERPAIGIGLMSGTSLDGMDAALVRFNGPTHAELIAFVTRPYSAAERASIQRGLDGANAAELARLHAAIAEWAADAVEQLLAAAHAPASAVDFIALHGQTVWHEPPLVSWQLGEPAVLAERFGRPVVNNFRSRDVAAGGQGAPLVPAADVLLFGATDGPRVLLNIGGMANVTYVGRRAIDDGAMAFDTGPGMVLVDAVARLVDPALPYDRDGVLAAAARSTSRR